MPLYNEYADYVGSRCSHPVKSCFIPTLSFSEATHARDVVRWCEEHFGRARMVIVGTTAEQVRDSRWGYWNQGFAMYFQQPDDAFQFKMRWC